MSLMGLFLMTFLVVHLGINLLLLFDPTRELFNVVAHFMGTNPVIQIFQWVLFAGFAIHIVLGITLQIQNWIARPKRYSKTNYSNTSFFSKFMIHTAIITLVFFAIHFADFYFKAKFGHAETMVVDGVLYHDFATEIVDKFKMLPFVVFYIAAFIFLGFHLVHGFQSAFKTLGLDNKSFTPVIQALAIVYSVIIVGGYTMIPLMIYFS